MSWRSSISEFRAETREVTERLRNPLITVWTDWSLSYLDIIRKWGRNDFHPSPKEVIHSAVIYPLLQELRQWLGKMTKVEVKSHTGCLLNERTDELAYPLKICLDWVCPGHAFEPYPIFRRSATPNDSGGNSFFFVVYEICNEQSAVFLDGTQGVESHHCFE